MDYAAWGFLSFSIGVLLLALGWTAYRQGKTDETVKSHAGKFEQYDTRMNLLVQQQSAIQTDHANSFGSVLEAMRQTNNRLNVQEKTLGEIHSIVVDLANRTQ